MLALSLFLLGIFGAILLIFFVTLTTDLIRKKLHSNKEEERERSRHHHYYSRTSAKSRDPRTIPARLYAIEYQWERYANQQQHDDRRRSFRDIITIIVVGLTATFALASDVVLYKQWQTFETQVADFRDQERRQLRGYLGVVGLKFSCDDCIPTAETDSLVANSENYGPTPLRIINSIIWFTQYGIAEPFPGVLSRRGPTRAVEIIPRSMISFPKRPKEINYAVNDIIQQQIWEIKNGNYWMIFRGYVRYEDAFGDIWDNLVCFIYNPIKNKQMNGFSECPKYQYETKAQEYEPDPFFLPPELPIVPEYHF